MIDAIAATLSRMYALYRGYPRHLLDTGVYLALAASIIGFMSHVLVAIVAWHFDHIPYPEIYGDLSSYLWDGTQMHHNAPTQAFGILTIALFASGLLYQPDLLLGNASFRERISGFPKHAVRPFLIGWMVLFALHLILYEPPFDTLQELDSGGDAWEKKSMLMEWFNLFSGQLVYYAVFPVSLWVIERQARASSEVPIKQRGALYLTVTVLAMGIGSIYDTFYFLVHNVLAPPVLIPFGSSALAIVISHIILLASLSIVIPALMIMFVAPVEFFRSKQPLGTPPLKEDGI